MFVRSMENIDARIDFQLNTANSKTAAENRLKLRSIAETVIFCGRQGLAFRGHHDDRPSVEENPNNNHGNFLGLLKFRVQAGDKVLSNHLYLLLAMLYTPVKLFKIISFQFVVT